VCWEGFWVPFQHAKAAVSAFAVTNHWSPTDLKNKNWFDLMAAAEEHVGLHAKFAAGVAGSKGPIHFESTLLGPDGRRWRVAWDSTVLRDEEGKVKAIANIGRDITQEKALEAHLRQAQKIESVGMLAGGLAHDFNNLLTVISGYTADLLKKHSPADSDYLGLTEIQNAAKSGARLTQQLLTFSRRRPYKPVPNGNSFDAKIAQQRGSHYLKAGFETRGTISPQGVILSNPGFGFDARPTSSTYVNPNTLVSGDGFATFLIGAIASTNGNASDWDSSATSMPVINFLSPSDRFLTSGWANLFGSPNDFEKPPAS